MSTYSGPREGECSEHPVPLGWLDQMMEDGHLPRDLKVWYIRHEVVADEGVTHFFVENHLVEGARSEFVQNGGQWHKVGWDEAEKYRGRGWRSVNEPHGVNSDGLGPARCAAFARDQEVCERVWSGAIGYPADGVYMEFHKKWGPRRGLRYWKITGHKTDLGDKHLYYPDNIPGKLHEHAQHFVNSIGAKSTKEAEASTISALQFRG